VVDPSSDDRYAEYREAIRLHVCAVCLDSRDDLSCGLVGRMCPIEQHLERLVRVLEALDSPRLDDYAAAIREKVCSQCSSCAADGSCNLRDAAACSLDAYLPLVLDAVEDVRRRRPPRA
jgi:hypothetical protein